MFKCPVALEVWDQALQIDRRSEVIDDLGDYWLSNLQTKGTRAVFLEISITWILWKCRIFQGVAKSTNQILIEWKSYVDTYLSSRLRCLDSAHCQPRSAVSRLQLAAIVMQSYNCKIFVDVGFHHSYASIGGILFIQEEVFLCWGIYILLKIQQH